MGLTALGCDRDKSSGPGPTGAVQLTAMVPTLALQAGVPGKAVVKEARVRLFGPKMEDRILTIAVAGGEAKGQVDDVPVGQVTVELSLMEEGEIPLWQGSAQVEVKKGQTADATIELQRAGDEPPQVDFQYSPEAGQPGTEFVFTAHVSDRHDHTDALQVRWDTDGDGAFDTDWSEAKELHHAYGEARTYEVSLEVRDQTEQIAQISHPVRVIQMMAQTGQNPGPDYMQAPLAAGTVQLTGHGSVGPESGDLVYHWSQILDYPGAYTVSILGSLTDNHSTSAASVVFRPELGAGLYVMTLEVEAPDVGMRSAPDTMFVTVVSNAPGSVVPSSPWDAVVGDVIVLQGEASDPDGDELQYRWRGERVDLLSDSTSQSPSFTAVEPGEFIYHFVAIDTDPQESPPALAIVQVSTRGPIASFRAEPSTGTAPLSVVFTNESEFGERYSWAFGDGETSTQQHPDIHVYQEVGQYEVVLQVVGFEERVATERKTVVVSEVNRPDVIIEELALIDPTGQDITQVNEGDPVGFRVRVRNTGAASATGVSVRLWLDGDEIHGTMEGRIDLGPQEESTQRLSAEWPASPGEHGLLVTAAVEGGGEPEANPDNNSRSHDFTVNSRPVAVAGDDVVAAMGEQVYLDGGGSSDPDGDGLAHQWSQISGPVVRIVSDSGARASIKLDAVGQHVFRLVVSDGKMESEPDEVVVTVRENDGTNRPPVAEAGPDQQAQVGDVVVLDGSGSSDPEGRAIEGWSWTQTRGPEAGLSAEEPWRLSFEAKEAGEYRFELVVHDDEGEGSLADEVVVVVTRENYLVETMFVDLPSGATMEFVWIEPGGFTMGSPLSEARTDGDEGPLHEVTISRGFWLGRTEVTQGQWQAVVGTTPWMGQTYIQANLEHPAVYISWDDVQQMTARLNEHEGSDVYRLPTEAEWEYACRAGMSTRWSFGDDEGSLGEYAWYDGNTWSAGLQHAQPVGTKVANPWGLFDMHGNVWEWVADWHGAYAGGALGDPQGPATGSHRVYRGGSVTDDAQNLRSAVRYHDSPGSHGFNLGARILRMPAAAEAANRAPRADAGLDQQVQIGAVVQLDGSGSTDPDGDFLSYRWSAPSGVALSSQTNSHPQFAATIEGTHAIVLVVNDGNIDSSPDTVVVKVDPLPQKPVADAGSTVLADVGETVQLDGSGSTDPDGGRLTYRWTAPEGVALSDATAERPRFVVPFVGGYRLELVVSNGVLESDPAAVWVVAHELVLVPGGTFLKGDPEGDNRAVHVDEFSIDKYEVTNSQYLGFVGVTGRERPYFADDPNWNGGMQPVHGVTWSDADEYCRWAGLRLPTEAEWEKAARGTDGRRYPWGDVVDRTRANYGTEQCCDPDDSDGYYYTSPVGSFPAGASPYGAVDMAGNAAEWTADWYDAAYYWNGPNRNPPGPAEGTLKVSRGGAWYFHPDALGTWGRWEISPSDAGQNVGMRCARGPSVDPSTNSPPRADAGVDQGATVGQLVQLVGEGSSDADGDGLRWAWSELAGNPVMGVLSDTTGRDPWFTPDVAGVYTFRLEVWDGRAADTDEVVITVEDVPWEPVFATVTTPAGTEHELALVPEGEFTMGSAKASGDAPPHEVHLSEYYIDVYEVTNAQYAAYAQSTGAGPAPHAEDPQMSDPQQPVTGVTWFQADGYCQWAGFRLPTEAQWEKAARGPDGRTYPWGDDLDLAKANWGTIGDGSYDGDASDGYYTTAPVGSFPEGASPYGVHDLAGNVMEWVSDWYGANYYTTGEQSDPMGPETGTGRVMRGGSFLYDASALVAYQRAGHWGPDNGNWHNGFRCATARPNSAPRASAGNDVTVERGAVVQLDGGDSSDPDGDLLSYHWATPEGISLSSTSNVKPQFAADEAGVYTVALVVNDGRSSSLPDTVVITVTAPNTPPVANAGSHVFVDVGEVVQLDGSGSSDADGEALRFSWVAPEGATLSDATAERPRFSVPSVGAYWIALTVSDGKDDSLVDSVAVVAHESVLVPAGEFAMGSDTWGPATRPSRLVHLDAFYIDKYEVTNSQFGAYVQVTGAAGAWHLGDSSFEDNPLKPRIGVTWSDARDYCEWAGMRLPTEAEWEKAARGTDGRAYPWGEGIDDTRAVYDRYGRGIKPYTEVVGSFPSGASPYGALDMTGNVSEWVGDWYSESYYQSAPNSGPMGPGEGVERVFRGGGWNDAGTLQTYERGHADPDVRFQSIGIRCSRSFP